MTFKQGDARTCVSAAKKEFTDVRDEVASQQGATRP